MNIQSHMGILSASGWIEQLKRPQKMRVYTLHDTTLDDDKIIVLHPAFNSFFDAHM